LDFQLLATCADGLTDLLAAEIKGIGGTDVRTGYRVVYFTASEEVTYAAHLRLRMAGRIFRILKDIPAGAPNIVFSKAKQIRFDKLFAADLPVAIAVISASGAGEDSGELPAHLVGSKLREAINDSFQFHQKVVPNQSSRDARVSVRGFLHHRRLMVSLDTSLEGLHKRGVRVPGHSAPLKETLAAALLAVCGYDGTTAFYDPMCGSGTIAIEAAQIATGTAPLLLRPKGGFGFEHLLDFNEPLWEKLRADAKAARHDPTAKIFMSDIDPEYVENARQIAGYAGMGGFIRSEVKDFFKTAKPAEAGTMIMNIPYGQRLADQDVTPEFLAALGDHLKQAYQGWRCGVLAPVSSPLKSIGLKPNRQAAFLNGLIPVKLLVFDIY
jgi:putative N6-adenine-specific DNA methylase